MLPPRFLCLPVPYCAFLCLTVPYCAYGAGIAVADGNRHTSAAPPLLTLEEKRILERYVNSKGNATLMLLTWAMKVRPEWCHALWGIAVRTDQHPPPTLLLPCCYLAPTLLLPCCYLAATLLLPCCYLAATFLLPSYHT